MKSKRTDTANYSLGFRYRFFDTDSGFPRSLPVAGAVVAAHVARVSHSLVLRSIHFLIFFSKDLSSELPLTVSLVSQLQIYKTTICARLSVDGLHQSGTRNDDSGPMRSRVTMLWSLQSILRPAVRRRREAEQSPPHHTTTHITTHYTGRPQSP